MLQDVLVACLVSPLAEERDTRCAPDSGPNPPHAQTFAKQCPRINLRWGRRSLWLGNAYGPAEARFGTELPYGRALECAHGDNTVTIPKVY